MLQLFIKPSETELAECKRLNLFSTPVRQKIFLFRRQCPPFEHIKKKTKVSMRSSSV